MAAVPHRDHPSYCHWSTHECKGGLWRCSELARARSSNSPLQTRKTIGIEEIAKIARHGGSESRHDGSADQVVVRGV
jgi:hypothetical protein